MNPPIPTPTDASPLAHWAAYLWHHHPQATWEDLHHALGSASADSVRAGAYGWCKRRGITLKRREPQRRVVREPIRGSDAPEVQVKAWTPDEPNRNHDFAV